ncbi:MAG: TRAP transporter TatT component family protein [Blastocatellia bacterium]|nr:TRAP transporter TatT component family protein [Blastocatellia bacterium]
MANSHPLLQACDEAYARRGTPGQITDMLAQLASLAEPDLGFDRCWRQAQGAFFLGSVATSRESRSEWYEQGVLWAVQAVQLAPERVEGHLWQGINLALLAESIQSRWKAPFLIWKARWKLLRAADCDPTFHGAAAFRVLGRIAHKAPFWLGGGLRQSRAYFERALRLAPDNPVTLLYLAELLCDLPQAGIDEARPILERLADLPAAPGWEYELERDRQQARNALLERRF